MKRKIRTMALSVIGALICASSAQADVVFEFVDGSELDGALIGATMTRDDGVNSRTITSVDVFGADGSSALIDGKSHKTNIYGSSGDYLGINDENVSGSEYQDFNIGEAWVFKFGADVTLSEIWIGSFSGDCTVTISSSAFANKVFVDGDGPGDVFDLGDSVVTAGTEIKIQNTGDLLAKGDVNWRIGSLTVTAIPEPATLGLMALSMGGLVVARRFRR
jgi:hypothetical protein